jgi:hypothetical protein
VDADTPYVIPVDPETCAVVDPDCVICTQEVEFERDNVIRAKESVLQTQLEDATIKLATAGCVTLDPAGRPVASTLVDDVVISSAVDSPLQSLGFYKKLMQDGYLGVAEGDIDLRADWLDSAARALGASMPKEGKATVDMVVYMNEILGLTQGPEASLLCDPCKTVTVREEVKGEMQHVIKRFLNYSPYTYDREANFSTAEQSLPNPAYIPDNDSYGWFEFMEPIGGDMTVYMTGSILSTVFDGWLNDDVAALRGFAQAADDTRAVINFMHTWPVPADWVTPVPCNATAPEELFDIFISPRSGLKVPVRMAAAGDGREGAVTVENAGPTIAEDVYVMVEGKYGDGETVYLQVSIDDSSPLFVNEESLGPIAPGYTATLTFFFLMDESADITWTATAYPTGDANPANNEVTKTTIVKKPKGGGGGHEAEATTILSETTEGGSHSLSARESEAHSLAIKENKSR